MQIVKSTVEQEILRLATFQRRLKNIESFEDRNSFTSHILKDRKTQQNIIQAPIHKAMQYAFDNYKKVLVVLPRGHGKTTQSLAGMLREIGENRNILIKLISDRDTTSSKRVHTIKQHIDNNPYYKDIYPDIYPLKVSGTKMNDTWGKTTITVARQIIDPNPTVVACSILSSGVGDRADILVFDDPCNLRNSILAPALRDQIKDAFETVWLPLLDAAGRIWYFATPWHKDDLTSTLREKWKDDPSACVLDFHVGQKLNISDTGEVLGIDETNDTTLPIWENFNREALEDKKNNQSARAYGKSYLCKAISDEDLMFNPAWCIASLDYSRTILNSYP